ncbi:MAG: DUF169 domain-containing protein [Desulfatiglans sp.]|nr:DUF169 domain-containing protein [Desulfatiglans sp.]
MPETRKNKRYGESLEQLLGLKTSPLAVKMVVKKKDIPKHALRPKKNQGKHYAQCQAFSLARRDKLTVAMLLEDSFCPGPVLAYGFVPPPEAHAHDAGINYEGFEYGRYIGILTAPLKSASFEPDLIMIYADTNQLRSMLLSIDEKERAGIKSSFFPFSCAWAVTSPIIHNAYWITLPDPGEYVRALTQAGEMIFSIPAPKIGRFMKGLKKFFKESMFANEQMMMLSDFPQPEIYKKIFKAWNSGQQVNKRNNTTLTTKHTKATKNKG